MLEFSSCRKSQGIAVLSGIDVFIFFYELMLWGGEVAWGAFFGCLFVGLVFFGCVCVVFLFVLVHFVLELMYKLVQR